MEAVRTKAKQKISLVDRGRARYGLPSSFLSIPIDASQTPERCCARAFAFAVVEDGHSMQCPYKKLPSAAAGRVWVYLGG